MTFYQTIRKFDMFSLKIRTVTGRRAEKHFVLCHRQRYA